jgi:hypothetical protein
MNRIQYWKVLANVIGAFFFVSSLVSAYAASKLELLLEATKSLPQVTQSSIDSCIVFRVKSVEDGLQLVQNIDPQVTREYLEFRLRVLPSEPKFVEKDGGIYSCCTFGCNNCRREVYNCHHCTHCLDYDLCDNCIERCREDHLKGKHNLKSSEKYVKLLGRNGLLDDLSSPAFLVISPEGS